MNQKKKKEKLRKKPSEKLKKQKYEWGKS